MLGPCLTHPNSFVYALKDHSFCLEIPISVLGVFCLILTQFTYPMHDSLCKDSTVCKDLWYFLLDQLIQLESTDDFSGKVFNSYLIFHNLRWDILSDVALVISLEHLVYTSYTIPSTNLHA